MFYSRTFWHASEASHVLSNEENCISERKYGQHYIIALTMHNYKEAKLKTILFRVYLAHMYLGKPTIIPVY